MENILMFGILPYRRYPLKKPLLRAESGRSGISLPSLLNKILLTGEVVLKIFPSKENRLTWP